MIWVCHHQHQHSLHLCSLVYLVFHFKHPPGSREERQRAIVWSTASVTEPESLRQLDSWLLSLNYKGEVYIIPYRVATCCIHRQQWEEEVNKVWQPARSQKNPSSHHVTITGQQFLWVVQEQSGKRYSTKSIAVGNRSIRQNAQPAKCSSTEELKHAVAKKSMVQTNYQGFMDMNVGRIGKMEW